MTIDWITNTFLKSIFSLGAVVLQALLVVIQTVIKNRNFEKSASGLIKKGQWKQLLQDLDPPAFKKSENKSIIMGFRGL